MKTSVIKTPSVKTALFIISFILATFAFHSQGFAADRVEYTIVIKNHMFEPSTLKVPTGVKIKLIVDNQDATPEEFESHDLHREKVIPGNKKAKIFIGPLEAGSYHFFGEFNEATAQGYIIAVDATTVAELEVVEVVEVVEAETETVSETNSTESK